MEFAVPEVGSIQRSNVILLSVFSIALMMTRSADAAIACILGGGVVIANLWIMSAMGRFLLAAAGAGVAGTVAKLGAAAIPLKLLIVVGLCYLVFSRTRIDGLGFGAGVLTQMLAIIIETFRASMRARS